MSDHPLASPSRREASVIGLWIFLGSECLFFGALLLTLVVYRYLYPADLASGTRHMSFAAGTLNTGVLLTSSLTMALAVHAAEKAKRVRPWLHATAVLGLVFLALKFYEWAEHWREGLVPGLHLAPGTPPHLALFFCLYFVLTGFHALHLALGVGVTEWLAVTLPEEGRKRSRRAELAGLYWHFVDLVWVFLYPAFYLWGRA